jgi:hypothetical protein
VESVRAGIAAGHVKPIIDRPFPLDWIADAQTYVQAGDL